MMEIYFGCSVRAGRDDGMVEIYPEIVSHLRVYGHVLSERFGDRALTRQGDLDSVAACTRDFGEIVKSNAVVLECSVPSLGVGVEKQFGLMIGKQVLCLYKRRDGKRLSAMIEGDTSPNLTVAKYDTVSEAKQKIDEFLNNVLRKT